MNKRSIILLSILVILLILVIAMNMNDGTDSAEVRPVAEGSVKAPGSGIRIGSK